MTGVPQARTVPPGPAPTVHVIPAVVEEVHP
jgi:hypothetical protein